jgi:signal transduction histidine kinase
MAKTTQRNVEEIKRSDLLRRELVANVSHDLRTPLASIQGYVETLLLKDHDLDPATRRDHLTIIRRAVEKLTRLVRQLFELSKLDARQIQPQYEKFAISELVHDVVQKFEPQAKQRDINLSMRSPPRALFIDGDIAMIERAVENLIDNALRYTPERGHVLVSAEPQDRFACVSVSDDGPGIPPEEAANIFDRFYRLDKSRSSGSEGAGLGLAITRKIVEAHGGSVGVESEVGQGSTFTIKLPLFRLAEPPASHEILTTA